MWRRVILALAVLLTAAACDQWWPSTGQTLSDDNELVIVVASCGSTDLTSSVAIIDRSGSVLWHVVSIEPVALWEFTVGQPAAGFETVVPLTRPLASGERLRVTTEQVRSGSKHFATDDSFALNDVSPAGVYVDDEKLIPRAEYQEWAQSHVCSGRPGLIQMARDDPKAAVLAGAAAAIIATGLVGFIWLSRRSSGAT